VAKFRATLATLPDASLPRGQDLNWRTWTTIHIPSESLIDPESAEKNFRHIRRFLNTVADSWLFNVEEAEKDVASHDSEAFNKVGENLRSEIPRLISLADSIAVKALENHSWLVDHRAEAAAKAVKFAEMIYELLKRLKPVLKAVDPHAPQSFH
jgi:hypothetical protein